MKTLTNIRKSEKHLKTIILISLLIFQLALKASEVPACMEEAFETEQVVEEWMLNLSTWAKDIDLHAYSKSFETESEIEDWMANPNHEIWNEYSEEEMAIEKWMSNINHKNWIGSNAEEELKIEAWMTDSSNWINHNNLLQAAAY